MRPGGRGHHHPLRCGDDRMAPTGRRGLGPACRPPAWRGTRGTTRPAMPRTTSEARGPTAGLPEVFMSLGWPNGRNGVLGTTLSGVGQIRSRGLEIDRRVRDFIVLKAPLQMSSSHGSPDDPAVQLTRRRPVMVAVLVVLTLFLAAALVAVLGRCTHEAAG